jgi:hypothetical protein
MKKRHETYRGIAKKKLLLSDILASDLEIEEALSTQVFNTLSETYDLRMLWINDPFETFATQVNNWGSTHVIPGPDEPDWDELGRIAEMEDFAERGLGLY